MGVCDGDEQRNVRFCATYLSVGGGNFQAQLRNQVFSRVPFDLFVVVGTELCLVLAALGI